jgi:hypothetical protein
VAARGKRYARGTGPEGWQRDRRVEVDDGTPRPDRAVDGAQAASFVGPDGVGAMSDASYQTLLDEAYAAVATLELSAGTIYYQKSWTALSLLMMTGNLVDFTQL